MTRFDVSGDDAAGLEFDGVPGHVTAVYATMARTMQTVSNGR